MYSNDDYVRFLRRLTAVLLIAIIMVVSFVLLVDPYRIYGLLDRPGFNQVKPQPDRYQEQIKLLNARASKANAFIFGNSRAEIGLNPGYEGFAKAGLSAYNLALSGTRISSTKRELEFLKTSGVKPEFVVLGVDFLDYLVNPTGHVPAISAIPTSNAHDVNAIQWQFDALFSLASVSDSLKTLQIQTDSEAETISSRGSNPFFEYKKYVRQEGYYPIFQQRATEYAKAFIKKPHGLILNESQSSPELEGLRSVLALLASESKESHVIIYPYHVQILAMFEQTGLLPVFEQWKHLLVSEVDAINTRYPESHIVLWDFSGYGPMQCELIPEKNDKKSSTRWYWEAGHFKQEYGDLILQRVLAGRLGIPPQLQANKPLSLDSASENHWRIQNEKTVCEKNYPKIFSGISTLINTKK